ncbi:MAG TPA: hypothetical protein VLT83_01335 [Opitutaceae bacterium]|nr:hypothetical protein [Opitutaceae bacterium]
MRIKHYLLIPSLAFAAACLVGTALAKQPKPPAPSPENHLLSQWYGDWTYKVEIFATPLGEGSKATGTWTGRAILGGNGSEFILIENGVRSHEIDFWDPAAGHYGYFYLSEDGYNEVGSYDMDGTTCVFSNTFVGEDGVEYTLAGSEPISKDGKTVEKIMWLSWTDSEGSHRILYLYEKATKLNNGCPKQH